MTFGIRGPWDVTTPGSPSKLNGMTIIYGVGADIAATDKTQVQYAFCTSTGSGFTVNHFYAVNAAQDAWIDISGAADHTHTGVGAGGALESVFRANPTYVEVFYRPDQLAKADWLQTLSSTGTITDDTTSGEDAIKLLTGATSGSGSTIELNGLKLDFSKRSHFQTKLKMSATTALALKAGTNCETVTAADDNTVKYEAQLCTVTNANWNIRTATGAARSESDTGSIYNQSDKYQTRTLSRPWYAKNRYVCRYWRGIYEDR